MVNPGDVLSYLEMCQAEGVNLQRGMNFRLRDGVSVVLMSVRAGAPYADRIEDQGRTLIYEGHDEPADSRRLDPKAVDQPLRTPSGTPTQNGLFMRAAEAYKLGEQRAEQVRVYEKIRSGIWTYNGRFQLVDGWLEHDGARHVCKFRLELLEDQSEGENVPRRDVGLAHTRVIPTAVKLEVWRRDRGRCVQCGSTDNIHFDHILAYSLGGSSLTAENVQLLCARHNYNKGAQIL